MQCLRGHLVPRAPAHIEHGKDISPPAIGHSRLALSASPILLQRLIQYSSFQP